MTAEPWTREFVPVPTHPPFPVGMFKPFDSWRYAEGIWHRIGAAAVAGAVEESRKGPRGGIWYAATEKWQAWADDFNRRASKLHVGRLAARVKRALGGKDRRKYGRSTHAAEEQGGPAICGTPYGMTTLVMERVNCGRCEAKLKARVRRQ